MAASPHFSVDRARTYARSPEFMRLVKYASSSVITTIASLVLLYIFYRVVDVGRAWLANVLATAIMTVPSYYLNRSWAWGKSGKSHLWREVVPFWVIAFVSLLLSTGAVELAAHNAQRISASHEFQTVLVEAANFITYALLWVAKFVIFNKVLFKHSSPPPSSGSDDSTAEPSVAIPAFDGPA